MGFESWRQKPLANDDLQDNDAFDDPRLFVSEVSLKTSSASNFIRFMAPENKHMYKRRQRLRSSTAASFLILLIIILFISCHVVRQ